MALPQDLEKDWRYGLMTLLEDLSADSGFLYGYETKDNSLRLLGRGRGALQVPLILDTNEPTLHRILQSPFPFSNQTRLFGNSFASFDYTYLSIASLYFEGTLLGLLIVGKERALSHVELAHFSSRALHFSLLLAIDKMREEKSDSEKQIQLLHQKLTSVNQRLLETDKFASLGHFAGGLAHELNTPLASIQTFTEYLEMTLPEGAQHESLEGILKSVGHCRELVENVLNLSRKRNHDCTAIPLRPIIDDAILLTASELEKNEIQLKTEWMAEPIVQGNHTRLVQVLTNLIMNAKDAIVRQRLLPRRGMIKIILNSEKTIARIAVIDNGPGISKSILGQLFDPFFTTKDVGEGMGLGLSISRTIAEEHHGSLEILSEENQGTRAIVSLPLVENAGG